MAERPDRDTALPVTEEVGGEGGTYADPTYQKSAKTGIRGEGLRRVRGADEAAEVAGNALHADEVADGGVGTNPDPAHGMKKYPTE